MRCSNATCMGTPGIVGNSCGLGSARIVGIGRCRDTFRVLDVGVFQGWEVGQKQLVSLGTAGILGPRALRDILGVWHSRDTKGLRVLGLGQLKLGILGGGHSRDTWGLRTEGRRATL